MKTISDFIASQCSASALDQIKGGRQVEDAVFSGCGANGNGGTCCEILIIYDDDTFSHVFI